MPLAEVLQRLGSRHVLVVHSRDGLDEISIGDDTEVAELKDGEILRFTLRPEDFGLARARLDAIRVTGPADSLAMLLGPSWLASPARPGISCSSTPARRSMPLVSPTAWRRGALGGSGHRQRRGPPPLRAAGGPDPRFCLSPGWTRTSMADTPDILKKICTARWRRWPARASACRSRA